MKYNYKLTIRSFKNPNCDTKTYTKKGIEEFEYLSKKEFDKIKREWSAVVVGDVKVRQRRYEDVVLSDNPERVEQKKKRKGIIGKAQMHLDTDNYIYHFSESDLMFYPYKDFDLYKTKLYRHCIGYAWVGGNQVVRLTKFNPLLFLIPLFLVFLIALLFNFCSDDTYTPIDFVKPTTSTQMTQQETTQKQYPLCYFYPLAETTTLTEDNKTIELYNVMENANTYYVKYEIYVDGQPVMVEKINEKSGEVEQEVLNTGYIEPSYYPVEVDLWSRLDAGTYKVECLASEYDYDVLNNIKVNPEKYSNQQKEQLQQEAKMPGEYKLATTLVVEK